MHAAGGSGLVAAEVEARLAVITQAARVRGEQVLAPLLILGTSERVGSNWGSDTLRHGLGRAAGGGWGRGSSFFAAPPPLGPWPPGARSWVLPRCPLGVASSFIRGD